MRGKNLLWGLKEAVWCSAWYRSYCELDLVAVKLMVFPGLQAKMSNSTIAEHKDTSATLREHFCEQR